MIMRKKEHKYDLSPLINSEIPKSNQIRYNSVKISELLLFPETSYNEKCVACVSSASDNLHLSKDI